MLDKSSSWFFSIKWRKYTKEEEKERKISNGKKEKNFSSKDNNIIQMSASGFLSYSFYSISFSCVERIPAQKNMCIFVKCI